MRWRGEASSGSAARAPPPPLVVPLAPTRPLRVPRFREEFTPPPSASFDKLRTIGSLFAHAKSSNKRFLRDRHIAILAHPGLALLLLIQQLLLAANVAAIALRGHVLAHRGDGFAGDDFAADGGLDRHFEQVAGDQVFEAFAHAAAAFLRDAAVDDHR